MKKGYILTTTAMNGTITASTINDIFLSKELAEKCKKAVDEKNKENERVGWKIHSTITECNIYETEEDCAILKETK